LLRLIWISLRRIWISLRPALILLPPAWKSGPAAGMRRATLRRAAGKVARRAGWAWKAGMRCSGPVRDNLDGDVAARGVAVGAHFLVRLVDERLQLGLRYARVGHVEPDGKTEAAAF